MSFSELGLRTELLRAVEASGYSTPTPIQRQAIPVVLDGGDVLAGAQTGTGKTAAFTLPLLQRLHERPLEGGRRPKSPRALVLTPTRELAAQVGQSVVDYGRHLQQKCVVVFGGVGINPQKWALQKGVDILVATPGRLLDLAGQRAVDLSSVEVLVLDEADRMLDMGFIHDIRKVLAMLPKQRQNLLFSATYSDDIRRLADSILRDPVEIAVARRNTAAETVTQHVYRVDKNAKRDLLAHLIEDGDWHQVLVFHRTKHGANRLAQQLDRAGLEAVAIHGNKSQNARTRALDDFKRGRVRVLVATDIAARGLDIEALPHVVNFELPNVPEDYVHRIGRTGRAGESGAAVSLVANDENRQLRDIERLLKRQIPVLDLPSFSRSPSAANEADMSARQRGNSARRGGEQDGRSGRGGAGGSGPKGRGNDSRSEAGQGSGQRRRRRRGPRRHSNQAA